MAGGTINLAVKTTNDGSGLKAASNDMDAFGGKLTAFSAIATGGLLALGAGAIKMSADYQQAMSQVAAVSGATGAELTQLKALGKDIGADTAFSARDAAGAMQELAAGGRSVAQIMGGEARAAVDLAAAGNYGLADSGRTIATVMDVWKGTQISTNDVVNRLAGAANASRFGVEDMSQAVAQAGGVAAQMGVSFEDFTTAIAMSASSFASGSDAGTSYKTMLLNLDGSTDKAKAKIDELGLSFRDQSGHIKSTHDIAQELADKVGILGEAEQTAALKVIFGNDAYRTAAAMMDGAGEAATRVNDVLANTNAADVAATRMDNAKGSFEAFKGSAETLAISLGEKALPAMTQIADAGVAMLNGFGGLPESTQGLALGTAALAISAPAAAAGFSKLATMASALATSAGRAQLGVGGLAVGVGALAIGIDLLLTKTTGHGLMERIFGDVARSESAVAAMRDFAGAIADVEPGADSVAKITEKLATEMGRFEAEAVAAGNGVNFFENYVGGADGRLFGFNVGLSDGVDKFKDYEEKVRAAGEAMVANGATTSQLLDVYYQLSPAMRDVFDDATNITAVMTDMAGSVGEAVQGPMGGLVGKLGEASGRMTELANVTPNTAAGVGQFTAQVTAANGELDKLDETMKRINGTFADTNPQVISAQASLALINEAIDDVTGSGQELTASQTEYVAALEASKAPYEAIIASHASNQKAMEGVQADMSRLMGAEGWAGLAAAMVDANEPHERVIDLTGQTREAFGLLASGDLPAAQSAFESLKAELSPEEWAAIAETLGARFPGAIKTGMDAGVSEVRAGGENLGIAAGEGFEIGINAAAAGAVAAAVAMANNAVAGVKSALQSQSPSKVFMAIGRDSGTGYALGLKASEPMVAKAAEAMVGAGIHAAADIDRASYSIPVYGLGRSGGGNNPNGAADSDALRLLRLLALMTPEERAQWAADPRNQHTITNIEREAAGLPALPPLVKTPGTTGPGGSMTPPGYKPGATAGTNTKPGTYKPGAENPRADAEIRAAMTGGWLKTLDPGLAEALSVAFAAYEAGTIDYKTMWQMIDNYGYANWAIVDANYKSSVYKDSDGVWRDLISNELAQNPDGSWKTQQYWEDAHKYTAGTSGSDPAFHTGGEHGMGPNGVTGAYASGYLKFIQEDYRRWLMRPNEEGHGALSDRFYNYGQDMSGSGYGKSMYGPEAALEQGIDPWHPNAMTGGGTRFKAGGKRSSEWETAGRRSSSSEPKVVVNVNAMDSQSFLRAAPQIREALRQDAKRGGE